MRGKHKVLVFTKRLKYEFELWRNLTIIRGDSATGKTTLIDMIRDFINNQSNSPVELACDKKCYVLEGILWKEQLVAISDSIVFIDAGNEFIKTKEFAKEIQNTDNYYVIVMRESLPSLSYSVEEIYGIRTSRKYGTLKQSYHEFYRLYGENVYENEVNPEVIITQDVLKDVGSGLNEKRANFQKLLTMVCNNEVRNVYVTYKDRLTRFGFYYLETIFLAHDVRIIVVKDSTLNKSTQEELVDDMMSLIASFSDKLYGMRSKGNRMKKGSD